MSQEHDEFPFDESKKPSGGKPRKPRAAPKAWKAKPAVKSKGPLPCPDLSGGAAKKPKAAGKPKLSPAPAPSSDPKYEFKASEYDVVDPTKIKVVVKVMLEPELEPLVSGLKPFERLRLAMKFRRWARQLEVSAKMMLNQSKPRRKPRVPRVNWTRAVWN